MTMIYQKKYNRYLFAHILFIGIQIFITNCSQEQKQQEKPLAPQLRLVLPNQLSLNTKNEEKLALYGKNFQATTKVWIGGKEALFDSSYSKESYSMCARKNKEEQCMVVSFQPAENQLVEGNLEIRLVNSSENGSAESESTTTSRSDLLVVKKNVFTDPDVPEYSTQLTEIKNPIMMGLFVGHFNQDAYADVVSVFGERGTNSPLQVSFFYGRGRKPNKGEDLFESKKSIAVPDNNNWQVARIGDVNGDQIDDVILLGGVNIRQSLSLFPLLSKRGISGSYEGHEWGTKQTIDSVQNVFSLSLTDDVLLKDVVGSKDLDLILFDYSKAPSQGNPFPASIPDLVILEGDGKGGFLAETGKITRFGEWGPYPGQLLVVPSSSTSMDKPKDTIVSVQLNGEFFNAWVAEDDKGYKRWSTLINGFHEVIEQQKRLVTNIAITNIPMDGPFEFVTSAIGMSRGDDQLFQYKDRSYGLYSIDDPFVSPTALVTADFNHDGHNDILAMSDWITTKGYLISEDKNRGLNLIPISLPKNDVSLFGVHFLAPQVIDYDQDGSPDLLCLSYKDGQQKIHMLFHVTP